ncbi:MAG TPA: hypothetical protein VMW48_06945 [Vicinamibacterales bacterium]|nr:hypothetical protein [Vicinamibacterales bacterium]
MSDFHVRSDAVDVEQIMEQIRRRVRDKRGVDYTEEQIRELANVRLEKFLDPKNLRSDLLEQFRRSRPTEDATLPVGTYEFEDSTLYDTHRGLLRAIRRLLNPILKLFFNPNQLVNVLHQQADLNRHFVQTTTQARVDRAAWNALYYEVLHNLVLETTRSAIELKNLKMRVEALSSRLDFSERRLRALEGVVQYRPEAVAPRERRPEPPAPGGSVEPAGVPGPASSAGGSDGVGGPGGEGRKRRRRRRGRRGPGLVGGPGGSPGDGGAESEGAESADDGGEDGPELEASAADAGAPPDNDPQTS